MRLSKIKLAGFKSFVDPVTINFPTDLTGIVGPNGCGKSNTIDAVRWVMGESSAKHLRGDSMEDVIFSGSSARKPVAQASVELVFDNSDASLGGEYAAFSDIALKRLVRRDGASKYFLNGSACRRRDITDIFLGTGLGPRSYAIIEQGMIARLIESKPQELRVYIEEAAGISKYKQRRKETERRIQHTRENLERLEDICEEIEKQISRLKRQSKTAERYKQYKHDERTMKAEVLVLKLRGLSGDLQQQNAVLNNEQTAIDKQVAQLRDIESQGEKLRVLRTEHTDGFNKVQETWYKAGAEISRVEQEIQHQNELYERQVEDRKQNKEAIREAEAHIVMDEGVLEDAEKKLLEIQPRFDVLQAQLESSKKDLVEAESAMSLWNQKWERHHQTSAEHTRNASVERSRMDHIEKHMTHMQDQESRLLSEQSSMSVKDISEELSLFSQQVNDVQSDLQSVQLTLNGTVDQEAGLRERERELRVSVDQKLQKLQENKSELATLNALQSAALGVNNGQENSWLEENQLSNAVRLGEMIEAESGWERAVEVVLGDTIEAVEIHSIDAGVGQLASLERGKIMLFSTDTTQPDSRDCSLWSVVNAPTSVRDLLCNILLADSTEDALKKRNTLKPGQSLITADGIWIGRNWVKVDKGQEQHTGVLERKKRIQRLEKDLGTLQSQYQQTQAQYAETRSQIQQLESLRHQQQESVNQAHRLFAEKNALLSNRQSRHEQIEGRQQAIALEITDIGSQQSQATLDLDAATLARNAALAEIESLAAEGADLEQSKSQTTDTLTASRQAVEKSSEVFHRLVVEKESTKNARESAGQSLQRLTAQLEHLRGRQDALQQVTSTDNNPEQTLKQQLEKLLVSRVDTEKQLESSRLTLHETETNLEKNANLRSDIEVTIQTMQESLNELRISQQESKVRHKTLLEQLDETEFTEEVLQQSLPDEASISDWEEKLQKLVAKIDRLGAINLAAIDEYKEQSERKDYLDSQQADLNESLLTLEKAIRKIDKETRSRFKDTFDKVNTSISKTFPKLFGGGSAHLELTEDDLLTSGVVVMARPPGKRISNIHLLSGGEKSLTAVSLVFAIFELNPAPFCMLDEVDAPLDEANVGRYCALVKEMSDRVQFIYITHNKSTMEMADQLMGVTMREAGVSRLVNVDVDEASLMATG